MEKQCDNTDHKAAIDVCHKVVLACLGGEFSGLLFDEHIIISLAKALMERNYLIMNNSITNSSSN